MGPRKVLKRMVPLRLRRTASLSAEFMDLGKMLRSTTNPKEKEAIRKRMDKITDVINRRDQQEFY